MKKNGALLLQGRYIRLVDQLAAGAALEERKRIARDLHDSVIQPYIGLRMGLAGLRQKLVATDPDVHRDVDRLIEMTNVGLQDLRGQVSTLRGGGSLRGVLVQAVTRFARRFSDATGIDVHVEAETDVLVDDRVGGEVFQIIAEGLSNIRRHTQAERALVRLACREGRLSLRIEDEGTSDDRWAPFTPRSITERVEALGGHVDIWARENGGSAVAVEIPL